ncbi:MAG TPA: hypothetical protein VF273_09165 [Pelobium sp.]
MITKKDQKDIQKARELIKQQIEDTKKLDLGLDADGSSIRDSKTRTKFEGFINQNEIPRMEDK